MVVIPVPQKNGPPEMRFSLVPRQDFQVEDTWRSVGLRGSGSNDILISDTFVPSYRTLSFAQSDQIDSPGTAVNDGPVYRLPTFGVFNLGAVGPALGLAQGALDAFLDDISRRANLQNSKIAQFMTMQLRVSEASAEIDSALLLYRHTVDVIRKAAQRGQGIEQGELLKIQRDCAYMGKLCQRAVERLVDVMGAGGLTEDNFVQLALADIRGACAHITMVWDANAVPYGKHLLGIPQ
jgi:3-hydroxy-9,10-secoandrosta-1,3,5(10)-triene-9,17-dione monooxygenase